MIPILNKKIKKRKMNLIIPKGFNHNLILPNYNCIILKGNYNDIILMQELI